MGDKRLEINIVEKFMAKYSVTEQFWTHKHKFSMLVEIEKCGKT